MNTAPLTQEELEYVESILFKYGSEESVLDISELDGFFTALVSGPITPLPSQWFPALWGKFEFEPKWTDQAELERFFSLLVQHMNNIAALLLETPEAFEALFTQREHDGEPVTDAENWCYGYMRAVMLEGGWDHLPPEQAEQLAAISEYGEEQGIAEDAQDDADESTPPQSVERIEPAARALHAYWLANRTVQPVLREGPKVGRNDPCPCGSGKKFKQCCLH